MARWRIVRFGCTEGDDTIIGGLRVWDHAWRRTCEEDIRVASPLYRGERNHLTVYEMGDEAAPVTFAAGELSNGIWGFAEPHRGLLNMFGFR